MKLDTLHISANIFSLLFGSRDGQEVQEGTCIHIKFVSDDAAYCAKMKVAVDQALVKSIQLTIERVP